VARYTALCCGGWEIDLRVSSSPCSLQFDDTSLKRSSEGSNRRVINQLPRVQLQRNAVIIRFMVFGVVSKQRGVDAEPHMAL